MKSLLVKCKKKVVSIFDVIVNKKRCRSLHIKYQQGIRIGKNVKVLLGNPSIIMEKKSRIGDNCVLWGSGSIIIGENSSIGEYCWIHSMRGHLVRIGNNVNFAAFVYIINCDHLTNKNSIIMNQGLVGDNVIVGNDVWIGANVTILKGTTIADGCVVGAGSTLKGKYNDNYSIICGPKAKIIKYRQ